MWVKLDDKLWQNRKFLSVSIEARAVYVSGLSYAGSAENDGFIAHPMVFMLAAGASAEPLDLAAELVSAGLWEVDGEGWRVNDWLEFNWTREQIVARRDAARERKQKQRAAKDDKDDGHAGSHAGSHAGTTGVTFSDQDKRHNENVSRRDSRQDSRRDSREESHDTRTQEPEPEPKASFTGRGNPRASEPTPAKQETISAGWKPSDGTRDAAGQAGAGAAMIERHIPRFRDHHLAKGTRAVDFGPMFVNWIRRALELEQPNGTPPGPARSTGERRVTAGYHRLIDFTDDQWA